MPQLRPVRYRCELPSLVQLAPDAEPVEARLVEISANGGFIEEVPGLYDVQPGDQATLWLPLPGGEPLGCRVTFSRFGQCRLEVRRTGVENLSVLVRGYGLSLEVSAGADLQRLVDFLDLLDTR